jgi:hypothetical protein
LGVSVFSRAGIPTLHLVAARRGALRLIKVTVGVESSVDDERRRIVRGIAALAVTLAEMGYDEQTARARLSAAVESLGVGDVEIFGEAAAEISAGPQYPVGAPGAPQSLNAQLRAREWLVGLAGG